MDLIYNIGSNDNPLHVSLGHSGKVSCTWSCSNLLAFTSERRVRGFAEKSIQIVDPNVPWDVHSIPCRSASVTSLQWNQTGTKLLCSDSNGCCSVWTTSNHLVNVWSKKTNLTTDVHGEDILATSWLHNGRKVVFHTDKFDNSSEIFARSNYRPSVTQLGGQPMEGYIVVTGCGYVVAKVITQDEETATSEASLDHSSNLLMADIAFSAQGKIMIMATDCDLTVPVRFWTVDLKYDNDSGKLTMQICVTGSTGSMIESWLMKKEQQPQLHPNLLQMSNSSASIEKMMRWNFVTTSQHLPKVLSITIPPLPISTSFTAAKAVNDHKFYCGIGVAAALADNTIQILHRLTLASIMSQDVPNVLSGQEPKFGKRARTTDYSSNIQHIEFSATSCALAVLDNRSSLFIYRVAPWLNSKGVAGGPLAVRHMAHLLRYCIITGYEWWDILLHSQGNIIKSICEQLSQEFSKELPPLQQMLQSRLLSVKISLHQTIGSPEAIDCHLRLLFEAITVVFRFLLRAPQDSSDEQSPVDKLHEACSTSFETDISKLLQCADADTQPLQSLQQLIQWVADTTLYLLAVVPQLNVPGIPGVSLLRDKAWLLTLRELLVTIQTWCLLRSACSPVFCCLDDQLDCIPHIFKLVTKVWHAISMDETRSHIPDDVVDECCLLPNQILIPCLDVIPPVDGVLQRLNVIPTPYRFSYGRKPHAMTYADAFSNLDFIKPVENVGKVDNLRRIYLGPYPVAPMKQCVRCGIVSLLNSSNPTMGFWDQRFVRSCLCGGRWKRLETNKKSIT